MPLAARCFNIPAGEITEMQEDKYHLVLKDKDLVNLPFRVLTQAFWRPQAFKKMLESGTLSEANIERKIDRLNKLWQQQESWINQSADAIFGSLPPEAIGKIMHELMPAISATPLTPYECRAGAMKRYLGVPDLFFLGGSQAVAGEMKIGATAQNGKYSFEQYTKYLTLALFMRASRRADLPKRIVHLLIVPTLDPKRFCSDYSQWRPEIKDGLLVVDPKNISYKDRKKRFANYDGWKKEVLAAMNNKQYAASNDIDRDEVTTIDRDLGFSAMQTRVVTWSELMRSTRNVAKRVGLGHLARSCDALSELGSGSQLSD